VGLASDRGLEVVLSVANRQSDRRITDGLQVVEETMGMASLTLSGLAKVNSVLGAPLDASLLGHPGLATAGLRLNGRGGLEVAVGMRSVQIGHGFLLKSRETRGLFSRESWVSWHPSPAMAF